MNEGDRDRSLFVALVALFVVFSVVFATSAIVALDDDDPATARLGTGEAAQSIGADETVASATDAPSAELTLTPQAGGPTSGALLSRATSAATASDADAATPAAPASGEILIGSVVSASGAVNFENLAQTIRAWVAFTNAGGGIDGRRLRLILYDDGLNPQRSQAAFKRLIVDDKVIAIVSSFAPLGEPSGIKEAEKAGVPLIPAAGFTPGGEKSPVVWLMTSEGQKYGRAGCREVLRRGKKRAAIVYVNSELVAAILDGFQRCFEAGGGVVQRFETQLGQPDYTTTALQIRQFNADIVFQEIVQGATRQLWQAMDRQGVRAQSLLTPGSDQDILRTYMGPAGEGAIVQATTVPPHVDLPAIATIKAAIARFEPGTHLDSLAVAKWVGCELFREAARLGGGTTTRAVLNGIVRVRGLTVGGLVTPLSYSPTDHVGTDTFYFFEKRGTAWSPNLSTASA